MIRKEYVPDVRIGFPTLIPLFVKQFVGINVQQPCDVVGTGEVNRFLVVRILSIDNPALRCHIVSRIGSVEEDNRSPLYQTFEYRSFARIVHEYEDHGGTSQVILEPDR